MSWLNRQDGEKLSEIIKALIAFGFSEELAKKTYDRWYFWLSQVFTKKPIEDHFKAIEEYEGNQLVIVKDLDVDLVCPHHLLPVMMKVHVGYLPSGKILGLSKFGRVAQDIAIPMTQEEYTDLLRKTIEDKLEPEWIMVMVSGEHTCMQCRGIKNRFSKTVTSSVSDPKNIALKKEFMDIVMHQL